MEIKTDDYRIWHDPGTSTVFFRGFLRLAGMEEYRPVMELLLTVIEKTPNFTINLRELEFLNSSGISMLSMFVIKVREKGNVNLVLQGSDQIVWQTKSLKNLQRLMPGIKLEFT
ncbi:MAG TPA: hypothetical protein VIQ31_14640 [Phormidium sp.]